MNLKTGTHVCRSSQGRKARETGGGPLLRLGTLSGSGGGSEHHYSCISIFFFTCHRAKGITRRWEITGIKGDAISFNEIGFFFSLFLFIGINIQEAVTEHLLADLFRIPKSVVAKEPWFL